MANDNTTAKDSGKYFVTLEQAMSLPCIQRDIQLEDTAIDPPVTNVWVAAVISRVCSMQHCHPTTHFIPEVGNQIAGGNRFCPCTST
mmetsp:Transcript_33186/g.69122  ORF Transcript_33186/g.69122 Transcript_33186/m.69122 type:complete len:87 (+) Transcript_33186:504-764(+)